MIKKSNPFFLAFLGVVLMLVGQFVASDGWTKSPLVTLATAMGDTGLFVARRVVIGVLVGLGYVILALFFYFGEKTKWYKTKPEWVLLVTYLSFIALLELSFWAIT